MKYTRVIAFTTAAIFSVGTLANLSQTKPLELNREFKIETVQGQMNALNEVGIEAIIKSGQNKYESVIISANGVTISDTLYDPIYHATAKILNNRELYREMFDPATLENDDYLMSAEFDREFPYATLNATLNIRIKNKVNGEVMKLSPVLKEISSQDWIYDEYLTQVDKNYYYVALADNWQSSKQKILIYTIDLNKQIFELHQTFEMNNMYGLTFDGQNIYGMNDEKTLVSINIESGLMNEAVLCSEITDMGYPSLIGNHGRLFVQVNNQISELDPITGELISKDIITLSSVDEDSYPSISELMVIGDMVYTRWNTYNRSDSQSYLLIFDAKSGVVSYEGKILARNDQGIIRDYELVKLK